VKEVTTHGQRQRFWPLKLALVAYLAYAGIRAIRDSEYRSLFAGVNFGVHELGHLVFSPFGEWITIAGGSFTQLLLPIAAAALFLHQKDRYAVGVCIIWLAISLADVAIYAGDARALELDLVSMSDDDAGGHDWNYLLDSMDMLRADLAVARGMRATAFVLLVAGSILAIKEAMKKAVIPSEARDLDLL
jgi:hypothetical protein